MTLPPSVEAALRALISHAACNSPFYQNKRWAEDLKSGKNLSFTNIPATSKQDFKENLSDFYCEFDAKQHGELKHQYTFGSTGEPALVKKTEFFDRKNTQHNLDLQKTWELDKHKIRLTINPTNQDYPAGHIDIKYIQDNNIINYYDYRPDKMIEIIKKYEPTYLTSLPSIIQAVLELDNNLYSVRDIATVGETNSEEFLNIISNLKNVRHMDV